MQKTLMASLIGLAVCTGNAFSPALAAEAKQPNLVIIMANRSWITSGKDVYLCRNELTIANLLKAQV